jgi:hypothetical protein
LFSGLGLSTGDGTKSGNGGGFGGVPMLMTDDAVMLTLDSLEEGEGEDDQVRNASPHLSLLVDRGPSSSPEAKERAPVAGQQSLLLQVSVPGSPLPQPASEKVAREAIRKGRETHSSSHKFRNRPMTDTELSLLHSPLAVPLVTAKMKREGERIRAMQLAAHAPRRGTSPQPT